MTTVNKIRASLALLSSLAVVAMFSVASGTAANAATGHQQPCVSYPSTACTNIGYTHFIARVFSNGDLTGSAEDIMGATDCTSTIDFQIDDVLAGGTHVAIGFKPRSMQMGTRCLDGKPHSGTNYTGSTALCNVGENCEWSFAAGSMHWYGYNSTVNSPAP